MNIDIRTLVILTGITSLLQVIALFFQYRLNKVHQGVGWWTLGFASMVMGYVFIALRDLISIKLITIIAANVLIILGPTFIYIGIMRFLNKKENRLIVISILAVFILSFVYYTYFNENITLRTVIAYAVAGFFSFLTAQSLIFHKTRLITISAYFNAALLLIQGCFFSIRAFVAFTLVPVTGLFTPTMIQIFPFLFLYIEGIVLTFGLIIMVNQRLNAESSEAKENLELIFNTSPDAVLVTRLTDGYFVGINDGFTVLTGYTRAEVIGKSSLDINLWKNPAEREQFVKALTEKGFCENLEAIFQRKDGIYLTAMLSAKIIVLQGVPHIISVSRDITERKQTEEEISRNDARLKSLVSILQQKHDTTQEFLDYALAEAINITGSKFGYIYFYNDERQEFVLNTWSKEVMKECTIAEPQTIYRLENTGIWGEAVRQRQPIIINDYQKPHPLKKGYPEGHAHLRRFLTVPVVIGDLIVAVVGVANKEYEYGEMDVVQLTLLMDAVWIVTERRQAEQELRESEEKHRLLIENSHDIIYTLTLDGLFTFVSPAWTVLLGHPLNQVVGQPFQLFVHPDDLAECMAWLQKVSETGKRQEGVEYRVRHINGSFFWHTSSAVPLKNEAGTIIGFEGIARDITERKQAEEEMEMLENQNRQLQKSESLGRMAAAIAHHFNNQLGVVIGNLELAIMEVKKGAEPQAHITAAMKASGKAAEMSRLMLTYLGQSLDIREQLDLSDTCLRDLPLLQAIMPGNVLLDTDLPLPGPGILANLNQIQQILTNLINNAREATEKGGGTIFLKVKVLAEIFGKSRFPIDFQKQDNAYACLEVSDTGCGIDEKDIEKLFDPFYSTKFTGRGMGLAVVLGIVKAYKGVITVESTPKHGSIFRVFFPLSEVALRQKQKAGSKDDNSISTISPGKTEDGGTVLLVEDEEMLCTMAATMLERLGFSVLKANDGFEALEIFGQHRNKIKFVLTDLTMPRMNGWDTLTALRKLQPDITVILASGYDLAHVMEGDHPELPQAFLAKPYNLNALGDAIGIAMGKKKG